MNHVTPSFGPFEIANVKNIALARVVDLNRPMEEMAAIERPLERLADCGHGDHRPDCPILHELAE